VRILKEWLKLCKNKFLTFCNLYKIIYYMLCNKALFGHLNQKMLENIA